ncbi:hypothetical protein ACFXAF_22730 [Kitasatospora sp. NPDC059463]|uniref:hypothetical protein n=1 Tax=unclassified Kitasatospora TaxID=2633591 RepID=UPI00368F1F38
MTAGPAELLFALLMGGCAAGALLLLRPGAGPGGGPEGRGERSGEGDGEGGGVHGG